MRLLRIAVIFILLVPVAVFAQLKRDVQQKDITSTLSSGGYNNSFMGFLDPARFNMSHSFSMSYSSFGSGGMMMNTYLNTINYKFSDKLLLTTKLGLMNSPINSLPANHFLKDTQFFGGAELRYMPSDKTQIYFRVESAPYMYQYPGSMFYDYRNPVLGW